MLLLRIGALCAVMILCAWFCEHTTTAQTDHPPLTILRKRVVGSRGATLVATNPATPYSLSGIVGLTTVGFLKADRSSSVLGFWVPRSLITSAEPREDVTAGSRSWVWPNPFVGELHINIDLPSAANARAHVYDMLGSHVAELFWEQHSVPGIHFTWNAIDKRGNAVPSGAYLVRVLIKQNIASPESCYSTVVTCRR